MKTDDYLIINSDGENQAEIVETVEQQAEISFDIPKAIHELAEDISAIAGAAAHEIGLVTKFEACREVFFGTVALATGQLEQYLAKQTDTPANEIKLEITDLIKDASINQVIEANDAIKKDLKLEAEVLEVAAAAKLISKVTEPPSNKRKWSLLPW